MIHAARAHEVKVLIRISVHNGTLFLPLRLSKSSSFVMSKSSSNESLFLPLRLSKSSSFVMSKSSSNESLFLPLRLSKSEFVTKSSSNESLFLPLRLSKSSSFVMSKSSSKENYMISLCRLGLPFLSHFAFHTQTLLYMSYRALSVSKLRCLRGSFVTSPS